MELIEKMSTGTDDKKHGIGVLIDLRKAFDTVESAIFF